jgi:hypothetical protein
MKPLIFLLLLIATSACTHSIHLAHTSDFYPTYKSYAKGTLVKARSEQHVIMGFIGNTDYVNLAYNQIQNSCQGGTVQGITTQYSTSHGFFSWTNVIEMQGLCIR